MVSALSMQRMQLSDDPGDFTWGRWYWCQPGARPLGLETCYGAPIWETDTGWEHVGPRFEIEGGKYARSRVSPFPGRDRDGEASWYLAGLPREFRTPVGAFTHCGAEGWGSELAVGLVVDEGAPIAGMEVGGGGEGGGGPMFYGDCPFFFGSCCHVEGGGEGGGPIVTTDGYAAGVAGGGEGGGPVPMGSAPTLIVAGGGEGGGPTMMGDGYAATVDGGGEGGGPIVGTDGYAAGVAGGGEGGGPVVMAAGATEGIAGGGEGGGPVVMAAGATEGIAGGGEGGGPVTMTGSTPSVGPDSIAGLVAWYSASAAYCFSDLAGTVPCTDGDAVALWKDRKGTADLSQATSGNRPVYHDDGVSRWVSFASGSFQRMTRASAAVAAVPMTFSCWYKPVSATSTYGLVMEGNAGGTTTYQLLQLSTSKVQAYVSSTGPAGSTTNVVAGEWQQAVGVFTNSTSRAAFRQGANKGTSAVSATATSLTKTDVGRGLANGQSLNGNVAEVAIWSTAVADADVLALWRQGLPNVYGKSYGGDVISGAPTITLQGPGPFTGITAGMGISGPGVAGGATVVSASLSSVTMSANATANGGGVYIFT